MASVNTQFSIAVHLMAGLGAHEGGATTSTHLSMSVNACPSFVRRVLSKLSKAGLVRTTTGKSGCCALAKQPKDITLLEIYEAVEAPKAFALHQYPTKKSCSVSCNIQSAMQSVLERTQNVMEQSLKGVRLSDVLGEIKRG